MEAKKFAAILSDKYLIDLKRMQHKYSAADVAEMIGLLQKNILKDLPLWDFEGQPLVYLENRVRLSMAAARLHLWMLIQQGYPAVLFQPLSDLYQCHQN